VTSSHISSDDIAVESRFLRYTAFWASEPGWHRICVGPHMPRWVPLVIGLFLLTYCGIAAAQSGERAGDRYRKSLFAVELQVAPVGGPFGMAAIALDVAVIPELSLAAGIGVSAFSPQWGAAVRPRIPLTPLIALSMSAGYSRGDYREFALAVVEPKGSFFYGDCSWINVDFGPEFRFRSGVLLRPFAGVSQLVDSKAPVWYESGRLDPGMTTSSPATRWPTLLFFGVSVGGYGGN
jgi:hypothetical protein